MSETTLHGVSTPWFSRSEVGSRMARALLRRALEQIEEGRLTIVDREGRWVFGEAAGTPELEATIHIQDSRAYAQMVLEGSVGAGRSYADGLWTVDDLVAFIRILARNREVLSRSRGGLGKLMNIAGYINRLKRRNSLNGSRENIAAHYDLSNDFFALFLDPTMMYSSAIFPTEQSTLEEASVAKLERICRKLELEPEDHLLDIGTGWGGLAVHAAQTYGCRVTTTTISREQHAYAAARIREAGLEDRITLLRKDYRELEGSYDKLVSVEMIEAVGPEYLDGFFEICSQLLKPDGRMLLQAITIDDREYERAARSVDFIKHFIFPGSCIPSIARMNRATSRHTDLRLIDLEDITGHYATTLARWRSRFLSRSRDLEALGFDARFRRLWDFYFAYCEGGFRERRIGDVHMLMAKPGYRGEGVSTRRRGA